MLTKLMLALSVSFFAVNGALADTPPLAPDIPAKWTPSDASRDFIKRDVMIPMRDGVKLHTVIVIAKGAQHAPILLTRTPYNASKRATRSGSNQMLQALPQGDELFVADGYIRVFQDIRGKYGSEGQYVMTRPLKGPLNDSPVDHATDTYDTIDWLVKNIPETNGKVGMLGSSYEGFTVVMALMDPHPALKVAAPECPMVDLWMGDDDFHYGAYRQGTLDYYFEQTTVKGAGDLPGRGADDYTNFLSAGSANDFAKKVGGDQLTAWKKLVEHPAYDQYWQEQALDKLLAKRPLTVPTLWVGGLWDQEDMWGAIHSYAAVEPKDAHNDKNFLIIGPWRHSGQNYDGSALGPLHFNGDTALQFRRDVLKPFFDAYLKDGAPPAKIAPVTIYNTGKNAWEHFDAWPTAKAKPLYLTAGSGLSFDAALVGTPGADSYVSDPSKPVPFSPRPFNFSDGDAWKTWLVHDQRFVDGRPDVLTYETAPLKDPVAISGLPTVNLYASTSGTDSDWVVKLIDVYPEENASRPDLAGYELNIGTDIFRGRYRTDPSKPQALTPNAPLQYRFTLPPANHVFLPGHRIMVQIQSTLFPLYDRNPQTFVPNIFFAKPADYVKATQSIYHGGAAASSIELPVVEGR